MYISQNKTCWPYGFRFQLNMCVVCNRQVCQVLQCDPCQTRSKKEVIWRNIGLLTEWLEPCFVLPRLHSWWLLTVLSGCTLTVSCCLVMSPTSLPVCFSLYCYWLASCGLHFLHPALSFCVLPYDMSVPGTAKLHFSFKFQMVAEA